MDREAITNFGARAERAWAAYHRAQRAPGFAALVARKTETLRHYDVLGMDKVVAVCFWGRSGSLLLSSFFDKHPDAVTCLGDFHIYQFFERHGALPLNERLIAYPMFLESFFSFHFPVRALDYYAAVDALLRAYADHAPALLAVRRTFFQFVHAACGLAIGRRPATLRPIMVYTQHNFVPERAAMLVEDFPKARFLHTIREPVAGYDSWFDHTIGRITAEGRIPHPGYLHPVKELCDDLLSTDAPVPGMGERTRAVRFEDMHLRTADTLRAVTQWLDLADLPTPGESTFNGIPYVAQSGGADWVGARPEQARRRLRSTFATDRLRLHALLYESFVAWGYPCPHVFRFAWLRRLVATALAVVPLKMEFAAARLVIELQVRPMLQERKYVSALRLLGRLARTHVSLGRTLSGEFKRRIAGRWGVLAWPDGAVPGEFRVLDPVGPRPRAASDEAVAVCGKQPDALADLLIDRYCDSDLFDDRASGETRPGPGPAPADAEEVMRAVRLLAPLANAICDHVFAAEKLHALDLPAASGRAWIYVRDDRPFAGPHAPAVAICYSSDRNPHRRLEQLRGFRGFLQTEAGHRLEALYDPAGEIIEAACWANLRQRYSDIWGNSDRRCKTAWQAIERIEAIYAVEFEAWGKSAAERVKVRAAARPLVLDFFAWTEAQQHATHAESWLGAAFRYTMAHRAALTRFLDHGVVEIDNRPAAWAIRGMRWTTPAWALAGGDAAATLYTVVQSAVLQDLDPRTYVREVLWRLAAGVEIESQIGTLLPWAWTPPTMPAGLAG